MSKRKLQSGGRGNSAATTAIAMAAAAAIAVLLFLLLWDARPQVTVAPAGSSQSTSTTATASVTASTSALPPRQTIASSVQGRPIELYTFGSGPWRVLIIGGIHGSEHGGPVARKFIEYLEEHPSAVPGGTFLQLVPGANPDGEAAKTRGNANGVDINRNFPSQNWQRQLNTGDRPTSGLTGGTSPGSEPETAALDSRRRLGRSHIPSLARRHSRP
jgi:protein MpaA